MKRQLHLLIIGLFTFLTSFSQVQTINTSGMTFDPDTVTITLGDTIEFGPLSYHNAVEVDESTWTADDTTYNGGFYFTQGGPGGYFIADSAKTYYYVCQPHVSMGMKGVIIVNSVSIYGCTDSLACNYDPNATIDDGSCTYWGTSVTIDTVCDSYVWLVTGDTLISSGVYTWVDVSSCDTNILNLTINNSTINIDVQSVIGSYTWSINGITYTSSIVDTSIGINSYGCSEMHILDLTILPNPVNLFFSEYAEGSSYNKYFEIYNPTNDTIDLNNYAYPMVNNGASNGAGIYEDWRNFDAGSVILPNDVFVVAHTDADASILIHADMIVTGNTSLSNGNDGMALVYGNEPLSPVAPGSDYIVLDWIGTWNGDYINNPGGSNDGWDVAGESIGTANHTIIRKCPISQGDTSWTNAAGTNSVNSQWIVLGNNDWSNSGFHNTCLCDSATNSYTSITDTICSGLSIIVGASTYDSTGVYSDTLLAFNGCDSIITTNLTVLTTSASSTILDTTICDGDSVVVGNTSYYTSGTYTELLSNTAGCDSTVTLNLTVQTPVSWNVTICEGDSVIVGTSTYDTTGIYTDTLVSTLGCDSVVVTNLEIYSQFGSVFGGPLDTSSAPGAHSSYNGRLNMNCNAASKLVSALVYPSDTNTITFELRDNSGSVLDDTTLTVFPGSQRIYFDFDIPVATNLQLGVSAGGTGLYRNNTGGGNIGYPYTIGDVTLTSANSSFSTQYYYFFYDIEIQHSSDPTTYSICQGDSITIGSSIYNTSGQYTDTLTTVLGCDSLVYTDLIVHPNFTDTNLQTICFGEVYVIAGSVYDSSGIYTDSLQTQAGCDSIIITNLNIDTIVGGTGINTETICIGDSITIGNSTYTNSGVYLDTLISANGCDSIVTTTLSVISANYSTIINGGILDNTIGGGGFYSGSQYLELSCYEPSMLVSAVVYSQDTTLTTFEIRDDNGNVLSDTTYLVVPGGHRIYFNYEMMAGSDYQLGVNGASNNLYRNNSGVNYPYDFASAASITSSSAGGGYYYFFYDVEVLPYLYSYNEVYICDGDSITIGGNIYNTPGQYLDNFVANNSCDSVVFTVLDFYQSPPLFIETNPDPPEICLGDSVVLEGSNGFISYWWSDINWNLILIDDRLVDDPTVDTWYLLSAKDSNDCVVKEDVWVFVDSCITGVNDLSIEREIQLYPNPASEQITIDFTAQATTLKVFNMLGELVAEEKILEGQYRVKLDVKNWKPAIYSMQLYNEDGAIVHKMFNVVR